jgi:hypothetical protein
VAILPLKKKIPEEWRRITGKRIEFKAEGIKSVNNGVKFGADNDKFCHNKVKWKRRKPQRHRGHEGLGVN